MTMDTADEEEPRRRGGPFRFWGEVRAEARKVTWATRQEVTVSTIMVLIFGIAAARSRHASKRGLTLPACRR